MTFRIAALAALLLLAGSADARAEPVTMAIAAVSAFIASSPAWVTSLAIGLALSGASLLLQALTKPGAPADPGVQFDIQIGDTSPVAFPVGSTATAGSRKYIGTWGQSGKTPNAYLTDVIQVADLPAPGEPVLWVNGQKCTILWGDTPTDQGYPVSEFRKDGKDYLWVIYRDGTETAADSFLLDKFGSDPDRPWKDTMIGRGCPHLIITALFNRDLFSGNLTYLVEPPQTAWYDLREDTTAGGSGSQRWNDPSTWAATDNPAVIIYNLIRGVYYGTEWVFGGQDLPAFRLPAASWMAAANECDTLIDLDGGGTQKQFRCGMEIRGDMEPLAAIDELRKACAGRLAEVGGIFKLLVGAPGSSVYSFTDGDVLVTKGQSFSPFPALSDTHNGIEGTYPEPEEMWASKDAPGRYSDTLEGEDGDRRLPVSVSFAAVPYGVQVQQLMRIMMEEERRFRTHSFYLPPDAFALEPNDVISWTSTRNGYTNKKFLVTGKKGERTSNQVVTLKEIDPTDYGWITDYELPSDVGTTGIVLPPTQSATGWSVSAATFYDSSASARRPSIEVEYDGDLDDVRAVHVQVRLASSGVVVFDTEQPYGTPTSGAAKSVILNGVFLPNTSYEARGIFVPYSGRSTDWSSWLSVTTPNVGLTADDLSTTVNTLLDQGSSAFDQTLLLRRWASPVTAIRELSLGAFEVPIHQLVQQAGETSILTLLRIQNTENLLRDAGIEIDRTNGRVKIWALDAFKDEVHTYQASVSVTLDAVNSAITLRATTSEVVDLINAAGLGYVPAYTYNFNSSAEGWTGTNATLTTGATALSVVATLTGGFAKITGLSLDAASNTVVQITVQRTAGSTWGLKLYWGSSFQYSLAFETPNDPDTAHTLVLSLTGATGWTGTLTQLGVGAADGCTFAMDYFTVGASSFQQLALSGITARVSTAEINISALQSAINAKVELATFNALSSTVTTVQTDLSALTATVSAKASQTSVDALSTEVTNVGLTLDALNATGVLQIDKTRENTQAQNVGDAAIRALLQGQQNKDAAETSFGLVRQELSVKIDEQGNTLASRIDIVLAMTNANTAAIVNEQTARTTAVSAEAEARQQVQANLDTEVGTLTSAVATEASARSTADSSLSSLITTVSATVSSNYSTLTASVSTLSSAIATINGKLAATATLQLDVDGYISGYQAYNDGSTDYFKVVAGNFLVAAPGVSGGDPVNVFTVATVNGSTKVALRGDMLVDGTIYARHVVTGEVVKDQVQTFSNTTFSSQPSTWTTLATVSSFTVSASGKVRLKFKTPGFSGLTGSTGSGAFNLNIRLLEGSNVLKTMTWLGRASFGSGTSLLGYDFAEPIMYEHDVSGLSAGSHNFSVELRCAGNSGTATILAGSLSVTDLVNAYI